MLMDITITALPIIIFIAFYLSKKYKHKKLFIFLHQYRGPILMIVPLACASYFIIMNGYSSLIDLFFLMSILGAFYWIFDVLKK